MNNLARAIFVLLFTLVQGSINKVDEINSKKDLSPEETLGVSPNVSKADLKRAYLQLSKEVHPDKVMQRFSPEQLSQPELIKDALSASEEAFKTLVSAYNTMLSRVETPDRPNERADSEKRHEEAAHEAELREMFRHQEAARQSELRRIHRRIVEERRRTEEIRRQNEEAQREYFRAKQVEEQNGLRQQALAEVNAIFARCLLLYLASSLLLVVAPMIVQARHRASVATF